MRLGEGMVTLACGPAGGWRGCVVSCALVFTLCRDQGDDRRRTAGRWAGRVLLWDVLGAEHREALQVFGAYMNSPAPLLVCSGFTSAQLCWVAVLGCCAGSRMGPMMGLRCIHRLSAGTEGKAVIAVTRRSHAYRKLCDAAL